MTSKNYNGIEVKCNEEDLNKQNVIYCLTFPNNKTYVGQTIRTMHNRISQHCRNSNCTKLKNAIKKYKTFSVSILSSNLDINQMNLFEQMFIKMLNSNGIDGYNLESGGMNKTHSDESKRKMSESKKNISDETKRKMSESRKGKTHSDETKNKISESQKNMTDETRRKMSESHKGKTTKKVKSIPDNIIFDSVIECGIYYNISKLSRYYNGKIHRRSGQTFVLL